MVIRRLVYSLLPLLLLGVAHWASAQVPVSAMLSHEQVAVGENFVLEIRAEGASVSDPEVAPLEDAGVVLGVPSLGSSTSVSIINGRTSMVQTKTWRYPARATREGRLNIPRIKIVVDGQEYFTQPMALSVSKTAVSPSSPQSRGGDGTITLEQMAFAEASTDKTDVFQGEPVTLVLRIFELDDFNVTLRFPQNIPLPDTQGFYSGPQATAKRRERRGAFSYKVTEISQTLYPTVSGVLTVGAWQWQGELLWTDAGRFRPGNAIRDFLTTPISVTVKPLPDRPANFSGAVGKYRLKSEFPQGTLTQGVPVRWTLTVSGEGNPDAVGAPAMPSVPWAHLSGPETEIQQAPGQTDSAKVFHYTLTPLEAGEHELPAVAYTYFAPVIKGYKTENSPARMVTVAAVQGGAQLVTAGGLREAERGAVRQLTDELLPIIADIQAGAGKGWLLRIAETVLIPLLLLPPAAYALFWRIMRHRRKLREDSRYARRHQALSRARALLHEARGNGEPLEKIQQALTGFVADMLNVSPAGITAADAGELLERNGCPAETRDMLVSILRNCERARYAGKTLSEQEVCALADAAAQMLDPLHRALDREDRP